MGRAQVIGNSRRVSASAAVAVEPWLPRSPPGPIGLDPQTPTKDIPSSPEGERRHATVWFSDLSGYTALKERLADRIKAEAVRIVQAHGGTVNQLVGEHQTRRRKLPPQRGRGS